ncbi:recombinase RecX [Bacteroidia bacterium]|nr:recombinase RecX [Bacteroidia bacterium]
MTILEKIENFCAYQERCEAEIREKLYALKVSKYESDKIVKELKEENFFDDARYAKAYARGKVRFNLYGKKKIEMELNKKHISKDIIQKAIDNISDADYSESLHKLIAKRQRMLKNESDEYKKEQKILQYILSHGFSYEDYKKL